MCARNKANAWEKEQTHSGLRVSLEASKETRDKSKLTLLLHLANIHLANMQELGRKIIELPSQPLCHCSDQRDTGGGGLSLSLGAGTESGLDLSLIHI